MHDKQDESVQYWIEEFLTARATRKPSPHTLEAYRRDLRTVAAWPANWSPLPSPWTPCPSPPSLPG